MVSRPDEVILRSVVSERPHNVQLLLYAPPAVFQSPQGLLQRAREISERARRLAGDRVPNHYALVDCQWLSETAIKLSYADPAFSIRYRKHRLSP